MISIITNYTDMRVIEAERLIEEEKQRKIKEAQAEKERLTAKKSNKPLSELSDADLLLTIGLPPFKDESEMTDEELDNE